MQQYLFYSTQLHNATVVEMSDTMRSMNMGSQNLTVHEKDLLRAMLDVNLKPAKTIAELAGVNRGSMISAIGGYRPLPADKLSIILETLNLYSGWEPMIDVGHYLRVGADIEPLKIVVDGIYKNAKLYRLLKQNVQQPNIDEPYVGFFLFEFNLGYGTGLALVHRDRFRRGKGVVSKNPSVAKAIKPEIFANVSWAENPIIEINANINRRLEEPFYKRTDGPDIKWLREVLNATPEVTWADVRAAADKFNVTTAEILKFIQSI